MGKQRVGYMGTCETPYCGSIEGYFCVRCKIYLADCRCQRGSCKCPDDKGWASAGERPLIRKRLEAENAST